MPKSSTEGVGADANEKPTAASSGDSGSSGPVKIDNKDKEILRLLNENARLTSKSIGGSTNISREVADYRIKRLIKNGLISGFITVVNDRKLGYESYVLLLQLQNYTEADESRILEFLTKHPFVKWVLKCSGDWDIQTAIMVKNKNHLAQVIDEIDNFCGKNLRKYDLAIVINLLVPENLAFMLARPERALTPKDLPPIEKKISYELANIDDKDKLLLKALATDARAPIVKVAQQIGLSADATNIRMKKLQKSGVIKKFQTVVDLSTLNYLLYSVFLKINNYSEKRETQIRTFLYSLPNITFAERILGGWDIRLQLSCTNPQELEGILQKIREFLGEDLKYYNFTLMLKEFKRVSYPQGPIGQKD
ncbi:Lrp/AsnC family transcriptional regulator [Candidatus Woesearchaeota archaeon]|nr:Lrp/AsnC family transcriptional regulator [Candidatus Woesearchaeota archaeon]